MIGNISLFIQGQGEVDADQLNSFVQGGFSDTQLQNTVGKTGMIVASQGTSAPGVGTLRFFYWDATATGGTGNIIPTGSSVGGWVKLTVS